MCGDAGSLHRAVKLRLGFVSDGPTELGKITQAQNPRLVQFALKLFF
jgi:hypothetical protein